MTAGESAALPLTLDGVRDKNLQQLKLLNQAIFPVRYQVRHPSPAPPGGTRTRTPPAGAAPRRTPASGSLRAPPEAVRGALGPASCRNPASCRLGKPRRATVHGWAAARARVHRVRGGRRRPLTAFPQEKFYQDCTACGDVTQLAYYNDILVGAIACRLERKGEGAVKLYIMTLGVLPPYRGRAVGTNLLRHSIKEALEEPLVDEVYLHVQSNNEDAINFYKKQGFGIKETIKGYYRKISPPDAVVLSKTLRP